MFVTVSLPAVAIALRSTGSTMKTTKSQISRSGRRDVVDGSHVGDELEQRVHQVPHRLVGEARARLGARAALEVEKL